MTNFNLQFLDITVMSTNFGKWLRENRKKNLLTMEALGEKIGASKQYISVLERGEPHALTGKAVTPTVEKVDALAKALNADVNEARLAAGYASQNATPEIAKPILEAIARSGTLSEKDTFFIADLIDSIEKRNKENNVE